MGCDWWLTGADAILKDSFKLWILVGGTVLKTLICWWFGFDAIGDVDDEKSIIFAAEVSVGDVEGKFSFVCSCDCWELFTLDEGNSAVCCCCI